MALLVARAVYGLPALARRAVGGERASAWSALTLDDGERIERALGADVRLYDTLRRSTLQGERVFVLAAEPEAAAKRVLALSTLLYPVRVHPLERAPGPEQIAAAGAGALLLSFELAAPAGVTPVAAGDDWVLSRVTP